MSGESPTAMATNLFEYKDDASGAGGPLLIPATSSSSSREQFGDVAGAFSEVRNNNSHHLHHHRPEEELDFRLPSVAVSGGDGSAADEDSTTLSHNNSSTDPCHSNSDKTLHALDVNNSGATTDRDHNDGQKMQNGGAGDRLDGILTPVAVAAAAAVIPKTDASSNANNNNNNNDDCIVNCLYYTMECCQCNVM